MSLLSTITRHPGTRYLMWQAVLAVSLLAAAWLHLSLGARAMPLQQVLQLVLHYDAGNFSQRIFVDIRLPRLCAALLTGAALGMAGLLLQNIIRNPIGEPHILGLNAGAALAVVLTSTTGIFLPRPLVACLGGALLFGLVVAVSSAGRGGLTPLKVTLCGVALSAFASALTAATLLLDEQTLLAVRTWLVGDLAGVNWTLINAALWPVSGGLLIALALTPSLNVLALGDRLALGLGLNLMRVRLSGVIAVALLCGAAVSIAGPIGFIGLVVPNLVRLVVQDMRYAMPLCASLGALILLLADCVARTLLAPQELATGLMTAFIGAPVFIFLASRGRP